MNKTERSNPLYMENQKYNHYKQKSQNEINNGILDLNSLSSIENNDFNQSITNNDFTQSLSNINNNDSNLRDSKIIKIKKVIKKSKDNKSLFSNTFINDYNKLDFNEILIPNNKVIERKNNIKNYFQDDNRNQNDNKSKNNINNNFKNKMNNNIYFNNEYKLENKSSNNNSIKNIKNDKIIKKNINYSDKNKKKEIFPKKSYGDKKLEVNINKNILQSNESKMEKNINNKIINKKDDLNKDDSYDNESNNNYGNEEDDDFENILRETLNRKDININDNKIYNFEKQFSEINEDKNISIKENKLRKNENEENNNNINNNLLDQNYLNKDKNINNNNDKIFIKDNLNSKIYSNKLEIFKFNINIIPEEKNKILKNNNLLINNNEKNIFVINNIDSISLNPNDYNNFLSEEKNKTNNKNSKPKNKINKKLKTNKSIIKSKNEQKVNLEKNKILKENKSINSFPIIENLDLKNPETKIRFINHNISNYNMLKEISFFEKLKSISIERYSSFIREFQKDKYFMEKNEFENIFIDVKDINIKSPLTLIFSFIFNPKTTLLNSRKNFFETIFTKRGDQNYSVTFDEKSLNEVPKFFKDLNYVNNLFNNFNKDDLILFLEEIKNWKKIFIFEQKFEYTIKQFLRYKTMNMRDVAQIYFISPYDLIVDYHSYGSNYIMADCFVAITQYRFHCDIDFNIKKGKFIFKTSGTILNTIKLVKKTLLEQTIINESNLTNKKEIQNNTWPYLKEVLKNEDKNNQEVVNSIFEEHLKQNLNKYGKEKEEEYELLYNTEESRKDTNNINFINNNEFNLNNNINTIYNINIKENTEKWNSFHEEDENEGINNNKNLNNKYNRNELKDNLNNDIKMNKNDTKYKSSKNNYRIRVLKYGVFFVFFLYIIKVILFIIRKNFSFDSLFYIFLILVIGYILIKLHHLHKIK